MMSRPPLISLVDDDESVRESLPDLLRVRGFTVQAFASAGEFLGSAAVADTDCLILDVAMPDMSGLELKEELDRRQQPRPIVFITAYAAASLRPRLLGEGVVAVLAKPFSETEIIDAVDAALRTK